MSNRSINRTHTVEVDVSLSDFDDATIAQECVDRGLVYDALKLLNMPPEIIQAVRDEEAKPVPNHAKLERWKEWANT